jgi:hypothetical protein
VQQQSENIENLLDFCLFYFGNQVKTNSPGKKKQQQSTTKMKEGKKPPLKKPPL